MKAIQVYLSFAGNCTEAMTFYQSCLGGHLDLMKVGDSPMADQWPKSVQDQILHSYLSSEGLVVMGSDMVQGEYVQGNAVTPVVVVSDEPEIRRIYDALSEGGIKVNPLHEFFAGLMGVLTDKFGITWMFTCPK